MSAIIMVACDADWNGFACRGAYPSRTDQSPEARYEAKKYGWHSQPSADFDLCPAHAVEHRARVVPGA